MTLTPSSYAYQFTQFCWTHMTLLLVVFQAHFIVNSIFEGLIWFFLPVCLVITNDIFAYICGMIWGKTPLIQLSPKKTVEGFIGGWICTVIIGGGIAYYLSKFKYMICPVTVVPPDFMKLMTRISGFQLGRVLTVNLIQSSFRANSKSRSHLSYRLENYSPFQIQSSSLQYSSTSWFSQHLHLSSPHLVDSSQVVSNELSKSKISETVSPDTVA